MKRIVSLVLALVMVFALSACGKSDAVKQVEAQIANIGAITIDSAAKIQEARTSYDSLSDDEKIKVENYTILMDAEAQYAKIAPIELTVDNIENYLVMNFAYSEAEHYVSWTRDIYGLADMNFECYSTKAGSYEDVEITINVTLTNGWKVSSSDPASEKSIAATEQYAKELKESGAIIVFDPSILAFSFKLPANGNYSEVHNLAAAGKFYDPNNNTIVYEIVDVSGRYIPG